MILMSGQHMLFIIVWARQPWNKTCLTWKKMRSFFRSVRRLLTTPGFAILTSDTADGEHFVKMTFPFLCKQVMFTLFKLVNTNTCLDICVLIIIGILLNSLAPGIFHLTVISNFQTNFSDWRLKYVLWSGPQMYGTGTDWWLVQVMA